MSSELKQRLNTSQLEEDDALDIEGDLTFIRSVEAILIDDLFASRMTA